MYHSKIPLKLYQGLYFRCFFFYHVYKFFKNVLGYVGRIQGWTNQFIIKLVGINYFKKYNYV
jgi:hypothetical protein